MQDNRFFILMILLVFSTSLNQGQKLKANDRRSAGLVPYPRIGRNSEISSFSRSERALGLIHQPRIGRSDVSSFDNLNRFHDLSSDADIEFYAMDMDPLLSPDYEDYASKPIALKYADKLQKDNSWLMPDHIHGYKDFHFAQKINDPRLYYSILRDSRNTQGQGGYTPRLGRENERDTANFL
ncbi:CAPA peptides isoform X2 [Camponotus floridanus]|uniref:CAPA peptides n=1 Tax=Camponotus floridanus TaxID=104421 RepID=CAPA_CAMFO|nr:CAPA peptides isoform X2 [Camponotus floridanus]E2AYH6.2 RecName: Full=CAPA peptides; Contains: RecName: Full=Periviscerokinin 1; Contains: RecName: Full=Periviscerokinin 2; Flags: Precursor [Camponotus floridanus]